MTTIYSEEIKGHERGEVCRWLKNYLRNGQARSIDVKRAAHVGGISERTLQRAREQLDVKVTVAGFPRISYWSLPLLSDIGDYTHEGGDQRSMAATQLVDSNNILRCPLCGESNTHLEVAHMSARQMEDGPITEITVNANGDIRCDSSPGPVGEMVGEGRRHRISLSGYCEICSGRFAIIFTQHKGETYVETACLGTIDPYDSDG